MTKTIIILVHPNFDQSVCNKAIIDGIRELNMPHVTIKDLYALYPDFKIDVAKEQADLLAHDRIIFQFPMYWFSTPALLKEWQDVVFTRGFSHGKNGTALAKKKMLLSVTAGITEEVFLNPVEGQYPIKELWSSLSYTANYCKMIFEEPICMYGVQYASSEVELKEKTRIHIQTLKKTRTFCRQKKTDFFKNLKLLKIS